jgi:hypothetical protein
MAEAIAAALERCLSSYRTLEAEANVDAAKALKAEYEQKLSKIRALAG